jgi:hypothetical protein
MRSPRSSSTCVGLRVRPLWDESGEVARERCGRARIARDAVTLHTFSPPGLGAFAFGRTGRRVGQVRVRIEGRRPITLGTAFTPIPPGGRDRYWIVPAGSACGRVSVQSLGWREVVPDERRGGRLGERGCG